MSRAIATFFYVGLMRPAPGTWGSAAAVLSGLGLHNVGSFPLLVIATLAVFPIGWWATHAATRGKDDHDPSEIVIDEVAGQWIAMWPFSFAIWQFNPQSHEMPWQFMVTAFVLFRLFDIVKMGPVRWADRRNDALGVMLDDVFAGLIAAVIGYCAMLWQSHIFDALEWVRWIFLGST